MKPEMFFSRTIRSLRLLFFGKKTAVPVVIAFLICLIPGITEEIAFRGLIQHWLHTVLKPWRAIVLTAALFTALHMSVLSAPILFLAGMLFGWVKWKSRSLYPSILMHIIYNWVSIQLFQTVMK